MKIRLFLADDHAILRAGLRSLLEAHADLEVVGEADNGRDALEDIARLAPDVAILDVSMPALGGIEAAEIVQERRPEVKVLMLSAQHDIESVHRALRAGALGYVPKHVDAAELVAAVRRVAAGKRYLPQDLSEALVDSFVRGVEARSPLESLSRRERQVLQLLAEGRTAAEIGTALSVSPRTVETYRARMMEKLKIKDFRGLVLFAAKHGLVSPG